MGKRDISSAVEEGIWNATYAAYFVASFNDTDEHEGMLSALAADHATDAASLADTAVEQFRRWSREP